MIKKAETKNHDCISGNNDTCRKSRVRPFSHSVIHQDRSGQWERASATPHDPLNKRGMGEGVLRPIIIGSSFVEIIPQL